VGIVTLVVKSHIIFKIKKIKNKNKKAGPSGGLLDWLAYFWFNSEG